METFLSVITTTIVCLTSLFNIWYLYQKRNEFPYYNISPHLIIITLLSKHFNNYYDKIDNDKLNHQ